MPEAILSFQSLPTDFQPVIQLTQEQHDCSIKPQQDLVGGWSGASIYLAGETLLTSVFVSF